MFFHLFYLTLPLELNIFVLRRDSEFNKLSLETKDIGRSFFRRLVKCSNKSNEVRIDWPT
jgi:hypothetical protein